MGKGQHFIIQPQHDKTNKMTWAQQRHISLGICPVRSETLFCAHLVAKDPKQGFFMWTVKTDQTERMPRLIWIFAGHTGLFVGFVVRWLNCWLFFIQNWLWKNMMIWKWKKEIDSCFVQSNAFSCAGEWWPTVDSTSLTTHLRHNMTKPTKWVCGPQRLRSAWASTQSDQSLRCPHEESLGP